VVGGVYTPLAAQPKYIGNRGAPLEGQTLRDRIGVGAVLPVDETLDLAMQIADGLQAAHEKMSGWRWPHGPLIQATDWQQPLRIVGPESRPPTGTCTGLRTMAGRTQTGRSSRLLQVGR
jgi:hypothetical protein